MNPIRGLRSVLWFFNGSERVRRRLRDVADEMRRTNQEILSELDALRSGILADRANDAQSQLSSIRSMVATLASRVEELGAELAGAPFSRPSQGAAPQTPYEMLPGTPYSAFALPVDYPPSRDLRPRWGFSRPLIEQLDASFASGKASFARLLEEMRREAVNLRDLPLQFSEANLPSPAWLGVPYCPFDGLALYTLIKSVRPARYLEVGSGITTCFAHRAIKDGAIGTEIISIDPQPRTKVDAICGRVIREGLETVDPAVFDELQVGDILFIDGSHRSFMNSDVTVLFIDILPRIKPGVLIHIHDISLPWDYDTMFTNWYWNEQYLLAVYLMAAQDKLEIVLPTAWVCRKMRDDAFFLDPGVDLGPDRDVWFGGGAMWFRKR